jgi:hypothetical protein
MVVVVLEGAATLTDVSPGGVPNACLMEAIPPLQWRGF